MRALELAKMAAESEKIRLQQMVRRHVKRSVYFAIAVIFGGAVISMMHVLLWDILRMYFNRPWPSAALLAMDIIIATAFGLLASSSTPGRQEEQAYDLRQQALHQARNALFVAFFPVAVRGTAGFVSALWRGFRRKDVKVLPTR